MALLGMSFNSAQPKHWYNKNDTNMDTQFKRLEMQYSPSTILFPFIMYILMIT